MLSLFRLASAKIMLENLRASHGDKKQAFTGIMQVWRFWIGAPMTEPGYAFCFVREENEDVMELFWCELENSGAFVCTDP